MGSEMCIRDRKNRGGRISIERNCGRRSVDRPNWKWLAAVMVPEVLVPEVLVVLSAGSANEC